MFKLIIFDLDGTLIDTRKDIAEACNYALGKCGYPPRELDEYNMLVGRGIDNLFRSALPKGKADEDTVRAMRSHFVPYYNEHKCDYTRPYEGMMETLDTLSQRGMRFAVASNKYQEGTEQLVEKFFGEYDFVKILGQRDGKPIKPDPMIVKEAMEGLEGVTEDEVIYCGDSDVDMQTGINAKVKTIGATWGFRSKEELAAYSPWAMADKPQDIIDIIYGN
jgi:phosphoglycolate phosphatase